VNWNAPINPTHNPTPAIRKAPVPPDCTAESAFNGRASLTVFHASTNNNPPRSPRKRKRLTVERRLGGGSSDSDSNLHYLFFIPDMLHPCERSHKLDFQITGIRIVTQ
jgi:hypothetical protein